jgi:gamma-glutamylcyclotransferase (GGCT)/AIG2-like uncharacterized protein YtfP
MLWGDWTRAEDDDRVLGVSRADVRRGDLLAVYGELLGDAAITEGPRLDGHCRLVGTCWIPGVLLDLGEVAGLVPGDDQVLGELWEVLDPRLFRRLDWFEGYDPVHEESSEYVRCRVELCEPPVSAWIYLYNGDPAGHARVASGDWRGHLDDRLSLR